jgi:hypothetical protein
MLLLSFWCACGAASDITPVSTSAPLSLYASTYFPANGAELKRKERRVIQTLFTLQATNHIHINIILQTSLSQQSSNPKNPGSNNPRPTSTPPPSSVLSMVQTVQSGLFLPVHL